MLVTDLRHFLDLPSDTPGRHADWQSTWATSFGQQPRVTPELPGRTGMDEPSDRTAALYRRRTVLDLVLARPQSSLPQL